MLGYIRLINNIQAIAILLPTRLTNSGRPLFLHECEGSKKTTSFRHFTWCPPPDFISLQDTYLYDPDIFIHDQTSKFLDNVVSLA